MKYAINEQIRFEMDLEAAKKDYQHQRKVEAHKFRKAMRKEQKRLRKMRWLIPGCMVDVERKMTTSIKKGTPNEH